MPGLCCDEESGVMVDSGQCSVFRFDDQLGLRVLRVFPPVKSIPHLFSLSLSLAEQQSWAGLRRAGQTTEIAQTSQTTINVDHS